MSDKPHFINRVTHVPSVWANHVSDLVYDVFAKTKTVDDARKRLGIGKMAGQDPANVNITGGKINNTVIGGELPTHATFTEVRVTKLTPTGDQSLVTKNWVDRQIKAAFQNFQFGSLALQNADNVLITGGKIAVDRVTVRKPALLGTDAVNLDFLQKQINELKAWIPKQIQPLQPPETDNKEKPKKYPCRLFQAEEPLEPCPHRRVYVTPFKFKCNNVLVFVDGVYQLPDSYASTNANTLVFFDPLPEGAVVGAVSVGAVDEKGDPVDCTGSGKDCCKIIQGAVPFEKCLTGRVVFLPFEIKSGLVLFVDGIYQLPDTYDITSKTSITMRKGVPADAVISGFTV